MLVAVIADFSSTGCGCSTLTFALFNHRPCLEALGGQAVRVICNSCTILQAAVIMLVAGPHVDLSIAWKRILPSLSLYTLSSQVRSDQRSGSWSPL